MRVLTLQVLEHTRIETENQSDSLAVAPVYYQYGHSMLLLAEVSSGKAEMISTTMLRHV